MILANFILALAAPFALAAPTSKLPLQADISQFLAVETAADGIARTRFFANINAPGTASGIVLASPSTNTPNYFFHWSRDAALTMDVVNTMYENGDSSLEDSMWKYIALRKTLQGLNTPSGIGEPKYEANASPFTGGWCRPQTDGPALTASTLARFANAYLANGGDSNRVRNEILSVVTVDLDYVAENLDRNDNCDLWEEVRSSSHFYTRMVQRRAFQEGIELVKKYGDALRAKTYGAKSWYLGGALDAHFSDSTGYIIESLGVNSRSGINAGTILASIHTDTVSGGAIDQFSPIDDRIQATVPHYVNAFKDIYQINKETVNSKGQKLGMAVGRYAEDIYDGIGTSQGNPWHLTTIAVAELYYRMVNHYNAKAEIAVTERNIPFFQFIGVNASLAAGKSYATGTAEFTSILSALIERAEEFIRRVQHHSDGGSLPEEYSRNTGAPVGARDLTWSYAAVFTATWQRNQL